MQITERTTQGVIVLELHGRLTTEHGAELLRDKVSSALSKGQSRMLLNLAGVPYIDSGGLGELVRCLLTTRKTRGSVKLVGLTGRVVDVLTVTKLITVFETYETETEALASFLTTA